VEENRMSHWLVLARAHKRVASALLSLVLIGTMAGSPALAVESATQRYLVVFSGTYALDGSYALGGNYALNHGYALQAVSAAGGTVTSDLSKQIGVMVVESANSQFYALMSKYALVEAVGTDVAFQGVPSQSQMAASPRVDGKGGKGGGGAEQTVDPLESQQWDMAMIRTPQAHDRQAGWRAVDVGVLDSGVDGLHLDFDDDGIPGGATNVDCARGRDFTADGTPADPGVGTPLPCVDNNFHGTHVAGTIAAQANGIGIVGVAPNVTIVPVKVCDADGHCYFSDVVDGLTYAGDAKLDVINMSFFVDDDDFQQSTEFKCSSDPTQKAFRESVQRALDYARKQGVVSVAALGNSDQDLAHPVDGDGQPIDPECDVVPAESDGVIGTVALGGQSEKSSYSNYGMGAADVSAPGGNGLTGDCTNADMILSTLPGNSYGCISGTSMASPHAAGVVALIVSQFGQLKNGDVALTYDKAFSILTSTTIDLGRAGYDGCFGHGRIDALRAVLKDTSATSDPTAPACDEAGQ
jgi:subtilisin family serine protease